jgi:carbamoyltransferase
LLCAVAEERLNRIKHFAGFPDLAIRECLRTAGARPGDIAHVAVARDATANLASKVWFAVRNLPRVAKLSRQRLQRRAQIGSVPRLLERALGRPRGGLRAAVHHVEHHLAHLASSFLVSPFEQAALLSVDGFGDFASTLCGRGQGTRIEAFQRTLFPHSLGILYTALCQFIGYSAYGDEGKVMGLAPYGEDSYREVFDDLLLLEANGRFRLNLDYFTHHSEGVDYSFDGAGRPTVAPLYSPKLVLRLGPARNPRSELTTRDMDLARSLQACLERTYWHVLRDLHRRTRCEQLCLAGGVALNSVANGLVLDKTPFRNVYVQAAAGDDGTAVGAAYWVLHHVLQQPRKFVMEHAYTGPRFSDDEIRGTLQSAGLPLHRLGERELLRKTASAIAAGKIVGWFQGAMEWGPRALGNRSILAHPGQPEMKDILNARIKRREWFRPFAPAVLQDRIGECFEKSHPSPFMLMVYKTRPEMRSRLCAVNHVDDTGRVQTVTRSANPRYYGLIEEFARLTGLPVLLNTSFNENEPIVCTPAEAVDCFRRTRMDVLVLGDFYCERGAMHGELVAAGAAGFTADAVSRE